MITDLGIIAAAWMGAYWFRFETGMPAPLGVPDPRAYGLALSVILPLWWVLMRRQGLYEPKRIGSLLTEFLDVLSAAAQGVILLLALSFFVRTYSYSRAVVLMFSLAAPVLIMSLRVALRLALRQLRARGYNLRYVLVAGAGRLAEEIIIRIHDHPESGLSVEGVLADGAEGKRIQDVPVVGGYRDVKQALHGDTRIDQLIIALPRDDWQRMDDILAELDDEIVSVKLAPDLLHILTLRSSVESLDGLPIISLRESPLVGWASVQKRAFDLIGSALLLAMIWPLLAAIGVGVLVTSGRPLFYTQRRVGLDGRIFSMLKFRTMLPDAEKAGTPVWGRKNDPRRTRFGRLIRPLSLDELPQLWNVLRGDMSLVGPRPERPVFIEEFRREIPGYMLRHKVKAGMSGWAQVHGWRGDTSVHERIEHDIYYIQNWSLKLDVQILAMTIWSVFVRRDAD
jgi:exopolysaccharide biosynthesis polyprenyl glycosylphosphotransferase